MSEMINFVGNYDDLSTDKGYQFKFHCDKCGNGHMSRFVPSVTGTAGSLLRAAGSIFGGLFSQAGHSAYEVQQAVGGKAHDEALAKAVEEAKKHFHQCTKCGRWVCPDVCWNAEAGLCEECAPNFEEHMAANRAQAMAEAAAEQVRDKARKTDYVSDVDVKKKKKGAPAALVCHACKAQTGGAKFCPECGEKQNVKLTCAGCGHQMEGKPKFCPECGKRMG